jgi:hypothetical protein
MQGFIKILLFLILNEAQHVSGDAPPINRSQKLQKQHLVLHNIVEGCQTCSCWTLSDIVRPKDVKPTWNKKLINIVHLVGYFYS